MNKKDKIYMPTGFDSFEDLIKTGCYYVDKSGLIISILDRPAKVNLFTRPRRFGKSLNISMLKTFFEIGRDPKCFDGLEITKNREICEKYQNKYSVVALTLKDVDGSSFEEARNALCTFISDECERQRYRIQGKPKMKREWERLDKAFEKTNDKSTDIEQLRNSLRLLSHVLNLEYGRQVILLIDEYDVPLQKAYIGGYYDEMVSLIRNFLSRAMKSNDDIAFAVMTGCMRISNESIFTGMNNVYEYSITDSKFDEFFGFTETEVKRMLDVCGYPEEFDKTKEWYDGYRFGSKDIYCPWDVVNHCKKLLEGKEKEPKVYWINSSSNDIIYDFLKTATQEMREDFQTLRNGGGIHKAINEHITYRDIDKSPENLWSVMYMTGYLTLDRKQPKDENGLFDLVIPNKEVKQIYDSSFAQWLERDIIRANQSGLTVKLWECDEEGFKQKLQSVLTRTVSFFDSHEDCFHGLLAGLLNAGEYEVKSNCENGIGRSDITVEDTEHDMSAIIEVKKSETVEQLQKECEKGLKQIKDKEYATDFLARGDHVILCGIAFSGKRCRVAMERIS